MLLHIVPTGTVSANLTIIMVQTPCNTSTAQVTSVAFPPTKIIARQENKSFHIVSWHKHFGLFFYVARESGGGTFSGFRQFLRARTVHVKNDGFSIFTKHAFSLLQQ